MNKADKEYKDESRKGAVADIMLFDCQKISFTFQALSDFLAVNSGRNIGSETAMCHC